MVPYTVAPTLCMVAIDFASSDVVFGFCFAGVSRHANFLLSKSIIWLSCSSLVVANAGDRIPRLMMAVAVSVSSFFIIYYI